jgi:hypothetical protein
MSQVSRLLPLGILCAGLSVASIQAQIQAQSTPGRTPVLVELFTSEGCSSCPPADALLAKLDRDQPIDTAQIIILGEHVDYWDKEGWHDRFSSPQYTDRQTQYSQRLHFDSIYTPQMIVDGTDQFVGNDASHARSAIAHAAQTSRLSLTLSRPVVDGQRISATVSLASAPAGQPQGDLYAALVDPSDTTSVRSGENGGRELHHAGVVRVLQRIGSVNNLGSQPQTFSLNAPKDATPNTMRVVVFAQERGQGAVLGAAMRAIAAN